MKIGGFEVGDYVVKDEGGKRHLVFDCVNCVYGASLADDSHCMFHALTILGELEAQLIVLSEVYERVYNEEQTRMLSEVAQTIQKFEADSIWSYSHLGSPDSECEKYFGERHDTIVKVTHDLLSFDPIMSYITLLQEIKKQQAMTASESGGTDCNKVYLATLLYIKKTLESTRMVSQTKDYAMKMKEIPETKQLYHYFFEAEIKPAFIGSRLLFREMEELELLDEYSVKKATVQVFKHPNKTERLYFVNPPEYTLPPEKYFVLSKTKEVVASYKPGKTSLSTVAQSRKYFERVYESTITDIAQSNRIQISREEITELAEVVARYTVGYGLLELLLSDRKITDIYIDSPIGQKPLYIVHSDFGQCQTNILYTEEEANSFVSKMRAMSGRPFDETHPVLDYDLPELETRVAVIGPPLSPDGTAFAFRLHKVTPWTLCQFIDNKFITPLGAGLLSFFIDAQATMLVTGSRGSGKTSLMSALMLEILQNTRILVQEDSVSGDCGIVFERNGNIEKSTIGELIDGLLGKYGFETLNGLQVLPANLEGVKVFALGKNGKMKLSPVSQFLRHKVSKKIFEIITRTGRSIKVTGDHSLFGLVGNKIAAVKCNELHEGSFIAVPRNIPWDAKGLKEFDAIDFLEEFPKGFICGEAVKRFVSDNFKRVKEISLKKGYKKNAVSAWKRNSLLPSRIFGEFRNEITKDGLLFKIDKDSKPIPAKIPIDENFLNIVGLWLADGCYDGKYAVIISTPDCGKEISSFSEKIGLKARMHSDGFSFIISNTGLNFFFRRVIGLSGNAYTKSFPPWVFNLSRQQIAQLLKGLYSGDGCNAKYEAVISLSSKKLIDSLQFFLSIFGIVSRKGRLNARDKTIRLAISSLKMLRSFKENIGFLQKRKCIKLENNCSRQSHSDKSDVIPFSIPEKETLAGKIPGFNRYDYIARGYSIGREKMKSLVASSQLDPALFAELETLVDSDIFWDEVKEVNVLGVNSGFVYDLSVPDCDSFVCGEIIAHNTMELPVPYMKDIGYNVQRLKTRSPISVSKTETEVAPEESLRTALRLGDSALVLGEVRSKEARVLYEAMRIGAAGNIVMGTIHGDSAYSVWDRVVNDLRVPTTSFKATDIVVVARPIRFAGSLERHRRVVQVTEVKKHWSDDPEKEGGLLDLMLYDAKKDRLELLEDNLKESELFEKIHRVSGMSMDEMWSSIRTNASAKAFLVELKNKHGIPQLLEAENTTIANNKLMLLKEEQLQEHGKVDYDEILGKWKYWIQNSLLKKLVEKKKKE